MIRFQSSGPRSIYRGIWVPMVTPFKNGDVDYDAAGLFARHLVDAGVDGLVLCGTTGEGPALSALEKARLLDTVTTSLSGNIPVFMGLEGGNTAKMIAELSETGDVPVDGYLLPAPSYVRPSQEGIYRHFMALADAVKKPFMIYDIPARTGVYMSVETITRLANGGDFPAIKACGLSSDRVRKLVAVPKLSVMCGDDILMYHAMELGACGAVAASAQVAPHRFVAAYRMFEKYGAGDGAWYHFHTLMPLIRRLFEEPNPAPIKTALALQNWVAEDMRLPMVPVIEAYRAELYATLREMHAQGHQELNCPDKSSK